MPCIGTFDREKENKSISLGILKSESSIHEDYDEEEDKYPEFLLSPEKVYQIKRHKTKYGNYESIPYDF